MAITILDHQPDYPQVDLTSKNAEFFEFFLQNNQLVEQSHPSAESSNKLFLAAHLAASHAKDVFYDPSTHAGFTHGFTLYEIISSLVAPNAPEEENLPVINFATRKLVDALHSDKLDDYLTDAFDEFRALQPITSEVISRASQRFHPGLTHYAVMGAAIERQFEIETKALSKSIVQ